MGILRRRRSGKIKRMTDLGGDTIENATTVEVVEVPRAPTKAEVKAAVQADPSLSENTKRSLATILTLALFAIILAILFSFAYVITVAPDSFGDISQALSTPLIIALTSLGAVASLIGMKSSNSGDGK